MTTATRKMTKRTRAKLVRAESAKLAGFIEEYILALGGTKLPDWTYRSDDGEDMVSPQGFNVVTKAGKLWLRPDHDGENMLSIYCRFDDVDLAKSILGDGMHNRLNPYSGKWNFHMSCEDVPNAFYAFNYFKGEFARVAL